LLLLIEAIMQGLSSLSELVCYPLTHGEYIFIYAAPDLEISRNPCWHPVEFGKDEADDRFQTLDGLSKRDKIATFDSTLQSKLASSLFSPCLVRCAPRAPLPQVVNVSTTAFVEVELSIYSLEYTLGLKLPYPRRAQEQMPRYS
jgi:hypothetical protein